MANIRRVKRGTRDPNKLLGVHTVMLSHEHTLGMLLVETDEGMFDLAINRAVAEQVIEELGRFLKGESETLDQMRERIPKR